MPRLARIHLASFPFLPLLFTLAAQADTTASTGDSVSQEKPPEFPSFKELRQWYDHRLELREKAPEQYYDTTLAVWERLHLEPLNLDAMRLENSLLEAEYNEPRPEEWKTMKEQLAKWGASSRNKGDLGSGSPDVALFADKMARVFGVHAPGGRREPDWFRKKHPGVLPGVSAHVNWNTPSKADILRCARLLVDCQARHDPDCRSRPHITPLGDQRILDVLQPIEDVIAENPKYQFGTEENEKVFAAMEEEEKKGIDVDFFYEHDYCRRAVVKDHPELRPVYAKAVNLFNQLERHLGWQDCYDSLIPEMAKGTRYLAWHYMLLHPQDKAFEKEFSMLNAKIPKVQYDTPADFLRGEYIMGKAYWLDTTNPRVKGLWKEQETKLSKSAEKIKALTLRPADDLELPFALEKAAKEIRLGYGFNQQTWPDGHPFQLQYRKAWLTLWISMADLADRRRDPKFDPSMKPDGPMAAKRHAAGMKWLELSRQLPDNVELFAHMHYKETSKEDRAELEALIDKLAQGVELKTWLKNNLFKPEYHPDACLPGPPQRPQ